MTTHQFQVICRQKRLLCDCKNDHTPIPSNLSPKRLFTTAKMTTHQFQVICRQKRGGSSEGVERLQKMPFRGVRSKKQECMQDAPSNPPRDSKAFYFFRRPFAPFLVPFRGAVFVLCCAVSALFFFAVLCSVVPCSCPFVTSSCYFLRRFALLCRFFSPPFVRSSLCAPPPLLLNGIRSN